MGGGHPAIAILLPEHDQQWRLRCHENIWKQSKNIVLMLLFLFYQNLFIFYHKI
jgi:hypothetical protein